MPLYEIPSFTPQMGLRQQSDQQKEDKLNHCGFSWMKSVSLTCVVQMEKAPWGKAPNQMHAGKSQSQQQVENATRLNPSHEQERLVLT